MAEKFERFIEKHYKGLNVLSISTGEYLPGTIINDEDVLVDAIWRLFPQMNPGRWKTKEVSATILDGDIQGEKALDIDGKILGVLSLKSGVTADYTVSFSFENCSSIVFDTAHEGLYENEVRDLISKLKKDDRSRWKDILKDFMIMETIFVENFKVTFKRNNNVLTEADVEQIEKEVKVAGSFSWNANGVMEISGNKNPFGVRGFTIKRFL